MFYSVGKLFLGIRSGQLLLLKCSSRSLSEMPAELQALCTEPTKWARLRYKMDENREHLQSKYHRLITHQMKHAVLLDKTKDPLRSTYLSDALLQAKRANLTKASINTVLNSVVPDQKFKKKQFVFAVSYKPNPAAMLLVECISHNMVLLKNYLMFRLRNFQGKAFIVRDPSSVPFEQRGHILVRIPDGSKSYQEILDGATSHAIEAGAEDVQLYDENMLIFHTTPNAVKNVDKKLEELYNYSIFNSRVDYIPTSTVELSDEDMEMFAKAAHYLDLAPEVLAIYDNIQ